MQAAFCATVVLVLAGSAHSQNGIHCKELNYTENGPTVCSTTLAGHTTYTLSKIQDGRLDIDQITPREYERLMDLERAGEKAENARVCKLYAQDLASDIAKEKDGNERDQYYRAQRIASTRDALKNVCNDVQPTTEELKRAVEEEKRAAKEKCPTCSAVPDTTK